MRITVTNVTFIPLNKYNKQKHKPMTTVKEITGTPYAIEYGFNDPTHGRLLKNGREDYAEFVFDETIEYNEKYLILEMGKNHPAVPAIMEAFIEIKKSLNY